MASIADILNVKWPGALYVLRGDDYKSLEWFSKGVPFPREDEIRVFSDEVDQILATRKKLRAQQDELLMSSPDALLIMVQALAVSVKEMQAQIRELKPDAAFAKSAEVDNLVSRIVAIQSKA